ncbi:unnamed protein product [Parajaminaea phylloscopi]
MTCATPLEEPADSYAASGTRQLSLPATPLRAGLRPTELEGCSGRSASRINPCYPHLQGPRVPSTYPRHRSFGTSGMASEDESSSRPVDIKARVAAFERLGITAAQTPPGATNGDGLGISRVSSVPRSRDAMSNGSSGRQVDYIDPLAEFGYMPGITPRDAAASNAVQSLPLPSSSSKRSLFAAEENTPGSAPLTPSPSPRKMASGTSLKDFTDASIARARSGSALLKTTGNGPSPMVSDKVPRPPVAAAMTQQVTRGSSPRLPDRHSRPPPPALPSASSQSSVSSSSASRHPLDDSDDCNWGLSLHPTLRPVASPVSSRAPSRSSSSARSAPSSPSFRHRLSPPGAELRVHPPTPSPERKPMDARGPPELPPRKPSLEDGSGDRVGSIHASARPTAQPPTLPPRLGTRSNAESGSPPYPVYTSKGMTAVHSGAVASKVPPPLPALPSSRAVPGPGPAPILAPQRNHFVRRHSPSASAGSSPLASPTTVGHRSTLSGPSLDRSPLIPATGNQLLGSTSGLSALPTASTSDILPPPTRTRASSVGPGAMHSQNEPVGLAPGIGGQRTVFVGSRAYRSGRLTSTVGRCATDPNTPGLDLASPASRPSRSVAPKNGATRALYETVWDSEMTRLRQRRSRKQDQAGSGGLKVAFHSALRPGQPGHGDPDPSARMPPGAVRKIWSRSRLPDLALAHIWNAAVAFDRDSEAVLSPQGTDMPNFSDTVTARSAGNEGGRRGLFGLSKEAFVRGLGAIDAELAWRRARQASRRQNKGAAVAVGASANPRTPSRSTRTATSGTRSASSPTQNFKRGSGDAGP